MLVPAQLRWFTCTVSNGLRSLFNQPGFVVFLYGALLNLNHKLKNFRFIVTVGMVEQLL